MQSWNLIACCVYPYIISYNGVNTFKFIAIIWGFRGSGVVGSFKQSRASRGLETVQAIYFESSFIKRSRVKLYLKGLKYEHWFQFKIWNFYRQSNLKINWKFTLLFALVVIVLDLSCGQLNLIIRFSLSFNNIKRVVPSRVLSFSWKNSP